MKWWEWIVVGCTVVNLGFIVLACWVLSDVFTAVVAIKAQGKGEPKSLPVADIADQPSPATASPALPVMPRWMDPASEKGLEFLAMEEILTKPNEFTEADRAEAEEYFDRLDAG